MRISWALQTAAVFCLIAVHPALAAENNDASDSITLDSAQKAPTLHFFQNFAAPDDTKVTLPIHNSNLLTRADDQEPNNSSESKHDRPRARPGPARSHTPHPSDHPYFKPGHEPRHRRPTGLPEHHHEKPQHTKPPCTTSTKGKADPKPTKDPHHKKPPCTTTTKGKGDPKPTKDPHHGKPPHHKPTKSTGKNKPTHKPSKSTGKHKPTHKPTHKPSQKPKPEPHKPSKGGSSVAPKPTTVVAPPRTTTDAPAVVPTPVIPTSPALPAPAPSGDSADGQPSTTTAQPSSGLGSAPNTSKMSGGSGSSNLATIMGAAVGSIALVGLVALGVYRRKERRRDFDQMGGGPEGAAGVGMGAGGPAGMDEAPRTAFRHESFMALVKDAAQGFYAPGTTSPGPGPSPLSAAAGAGAGAASLSRQTSARSQNSQRSMPYRRSGNFSGHGVPPSSPPPLAHLGGRS
ncbi:hypothetical protein EMPS_10188 [Entomortierella parvispora]|uniref:Mid2 domain-containing protein n=1 Tax=Entomortierella parvispora TaxID=205924 RepID=A0A9P3M0Z8_9FUNG|nr:hypothetical protein EMPS_10188 [Entomortierella parvispora]